MSRPLRLLQIAGTAEGGSWFVGQVTELQRRGHRVLAVVPDAGPVADALAISGVPTKVVRFKGGQPWDLPRVLAAQVQLVRLVRTYRPDIVHAHLFKAIVVARVAAWIGGVPCVSQWPGDVHLEVPILRFLDYSTQRLDSVTVGSNRRIADHYRAVGASNVDLAYYGLATADWDPDAPEFADADSDVRRELAIASDVPIVTMVAHMYPTRLKAFREIGVKGHETLIDAAAHLAQDGRRVQFLIVGDELVGDGSYRRALEARASAIGLGSRVRFLGHRDDIARIVRASDVITVPSIRESASYAAIQALLMRRPVVASRTGGLTDSVQHEETGLLVPPGDSVALADGIARLLDSPSDRAEMGRLGRTRVRERFEMSRTVDRIEAIYRSVLGGIETDA